MKSIFNFRAATVIAALAMATAVTAAHATPVIVNGGFETVTGLPNGNSSEFGTAFNGGQVTVAGWATGGYNFLVQPGTADTTGMVSQFSHVDGTTGQLVPDVTFWGPNNGGSADNHMPPTSPAGGNYVALDGAFNVGALTQTVTGLTPGKNFAITFYFAGAQQGPADGAGGYDGAQTEQLEVSLGGDSQLTQVIDNPSHDFSGWYSETMIFKATSASETLSFLAIGTPSGVPPMSLLDGVTISQTPEPSSLAFMATGLLGVGGIVRSRFKKA